MRIDCQDGSHITITVAANSVKFEASKDSARYEMGGDVAGVRHIARSLIEATDLAEALGRFERSDKIGRPG